MQNKESAVSNQMKISSHFSPPPLPSLPPFSTLLSSLLPSSPHLTRDCCKIKHSDVAKFFFYLGFCEIKESLDTSKTLGHRPWYGNLGTWNKDLGKGTWYPGPETRDLISMTWDKGPGKAGIRDLVSETWDQEPGNKGAMPGTYRGLKLWD